MMDWVVCVDGSRDLNSRSSEKNFRLMERNLDWAKIPNTSAYKSAIMWILVAFGPRIALFKKNQNFDQDLIK